jgi:hypothetical protein
MPSVSKSQRRFMAMCEHDPKHAQGKCPDMTKEQMHDFAATKERGLPEYAGDKPDTLLQEARAHGLEENQKTRKGAK